MYIYNNMSLNYSSNEDVLEKIFRENQNTSLWAINFFPPKSVRL